MKKINIYCGWDLRFDFQSDKQVGLWVDNFNGIDNNNDDIKVLFLCEPNSISGIADLAIANHKKFDYILTHDEKILKSCSNAVVFEFGGCWIHDYHFPEKEFSVSTVVGSKRMASGHYLRHDLWRRQSEIKIPKKFYISGHDQHFKRIPEIEENPVLEGDKKKLFDSMFHIAIENCSVNYYFSEKLIDCLETKTVPIYWGCKNIGDYFHTDGMFIVDSVDQIIDICNNQISEEKFKEMKPYIDENYQFAQNYKNLGERIANKLKETIE